jgi:hypothetical protein
VPNAATENKETEESIAAQAEIDMMLNQQDGFT